ncbi:hypothetical protein EPN52_05425 [bacterium]|nr:MAG: hypothetical protein EPN52_05425 [bacterium]
MVIRPPIDVTYADAPRVIAWEVARSGMSPADALTTAQAKAFIADVARCGSPLLCITGDAFARTDLCEIIAAASALGLRSIVSTRAAGAPGAESLRRLYAAGCTRLAVPVDTPQADLRTALAARAAGFELHAETLLTLRNLGQLRELAALLPPLGISLWNVRFVLAPLHAAAQDGLNAEQTEAACATLFALWLNAPFDLRVWEAPDYAHYAARRLESMDQAARPAKAASALFAVPAMSEGRGYVFVSARGEIRPSESAPIALGDVRTQHLLDVYRDDPTLRRLRDL